MQQVLAQMLSKYQIRDIGDKKNAIKEILAKIKNRKWKAQFIAENNLDTALQNQKFVSEWI